MLLTWRTVRHQLLPDGILVRPLGIGITRGPGPRAAPLVALPLPATARLVGAEQQVLPLAGRGVEHHGGEVRAAVVPEHEELELPQLLVLHELGPARGEEGALGGPADDHQPRPPAGALQGGRH